MSTDGWIFAVGTVATFCTTAAFVPQIVKIWRQGGRDLSYGMLVLYLTGVLLWLVYGLLTGALAVILANVGAAILVSVSLGLKRFMEVRGPMGADYPPESAASAAAPGGVAPSRSSR
jgi:MtN3 and saliva related transmembrane protein